MCADIPTDPPPSAAPLEIIPGLFMQVAARLAQDLCVEASRTAPLRPPFLGVLALIKANPGIRQGLCASALGFDATTFGRYVDRMVRDGYAERSVPTEDRRAVCLSLTPTGLEALEATEDELANMGDIFRQRMGARDWDRLNSLLVRFLTVHDHPLPSLAQEERLPNDTFPLE
ncbi:MarR family winged helix-turn-helix transcriptional regulator [Tropicimonas sp. IMCC34043]|uniref:MarR family winged helix-turn-helix transcriptional regulator n=1 Tax=Tropicimonas sp. IMCC34043 TaxID=2248760 RepID=UPI0013009D61|nr:MarR family transcriptional regulator [Tropicimonas sp. IMCC34043]